MNSQNNIKTITYNFPQVSLSKSLEEVSNAIQKAKEEAKLITSNAQNESDKLAQEAKEKGYLEGLKDGLTKFVNFRRAKNTLLNELNDYILSVITQVTKEILDDCLTKDELRGHYLEKKFNDLQKEISSQNLSESSFFKITLSSEDHLLTKELIDKYFPNIPIIESQSVSKGEIKLETDVGSIEHLPEEHLESILEHLHAQTKKDKAIIEQVNNFTDKILK